MNDKQIECFLAVAETLNFTQAAEKTYMSQPTISRLIGTFETELGVRLFYRTNKEVRLTPAGVILFELFHKFTEEYKEAAARAKNIDSGMEGRLKIGLPGNLDMDDLWEHTIPEFQRNHPNVCLEYECASSIKTIFEKVLTEEFDVSFIHTNERIDSKKILSDEVLTTKMKLVCGKGHPIAKKGFFEKEDLEKAVVWTVFPEEIQIKILQEMYEGFGISQFSVKSTEDFNTALINVRMGNGILYIDPVTKRLDENFYVLLELPESYGEISFSVIWSKKNMNPALPMLLEFLVTK